ncbi:MAG: DUF1622 domain-containing protein [Gammaproteobacteria bacterium]|nr:DUF1622 domain-containing protein [Gammaproteobacteria bacterium]
MIIAVATGIALFDLGRTAFGREGEDGAELVRLAFAQRLVLALEFLIAADILATLHTPSLEGVGLLGAIIAIRTILVHSIAYEVRHAERR